VSLPVPNLSSALVDKLGKIIPPWNSWFQQFTQPAPEAVPVAGSIFIANAPGNVFIQSGNPNMAIVRGTLTITVTGQKIIPIAIGDTLNLSGAYTASFLGS
jgi:hypothetical protein